MTEISRFIRLSREREEKDSGKSCSRLLKANKNILTFRRRDKKREREETTKKSGKKIQSYGFIDIK